MASTDCTSLATSYATKRRCCPAVWLPSWTAQADPVHQLVTAKSGVAWIYILRIIALIVPLSQAGRLSFNKCGLNMVNFLGTTALGTTSPGADTLYNGRLPFPFASWAFPLSLRVAASQHLLWQLFILAVIPILSCVRCCSGQGVVQANHPVSAEWALGASSSAGHTCCPDVWLPCWALVALPHSLDETMWLDPYCTQVHIPVDMPLLLQFLAEHADVW